MEFGVGRPTLEFHACCVTFGRSDIGSLSDILFVIFASKMGMIRVASDGDCGYEMK